PEAVKALYEGVEWTHGDPARAGELVRHMMENRMDAETIGNVMPIDKIPDARISDLESRAGNSIFNPFNEAVQENFTIDLGKVLPDLQVGEKSKMSVRYVPVLGMKAYGGAPDRYEGGWHWTELEQKKAKLIEAAKNMNWENPHQVEQLRGRTTEYM